MTVLNLNADMGESFGAYTMGDDRVLMPSVQSANIACGFHGGDPLIMQETVALALEENVSIGAHPSYPDLQGFGRRAMDMSANDVHAMMVYQIGALMGVCQSLNAKVSHVKPHGALNNLACEDASLAETLCKAIVDIDQDLILLAPALSELSMAGQRAGLPVAEEIFADRAYRDDAMLVKRDQPGALIHDPTECLERVLQMVEKQGLITSSGKLLPCAIHSICVHGDSFHASETAAYLKKGLLENGIQLHRLDRMSLSS